MKAVIQRVSNASVKVDGNVTASIRKGLLVLVGFESTDAAEDLQWMATKLVNMRIMNDSNGVMNLSVKDVDGGIILVSQFTLHASTRKGNRPSYMKAAKPDIAIPLYREFTDIVTLTLGKEVGTGIFGAHMYVELTNDGPVTIVIDSKNKT